MGRIGVVVVLCLSIFLVACSNEEEKTAASATSSIGEKDKAVSKEKETSAKADTIIKNLVINQKTDKKMSKEEKQLVEDLQGFIDEFNAVVLKKSKEDFNAKNYEKYIDMRTFGMSKKEKKELLKNGLKDHQPETDREERRKVTILRILDDSIPSDYDEPYILASALYTAEIDYFDEDGNVKSSEMTHDEEEFIVKVIRADTPYGFRLENMGTPDHYD